MTEKLVKAVLSCLDTQEHIEVLWNPSRYRIQRQNQLGSSHLSAQPTAQFQVASSIENFSVDLFIDTTENSPGPQRDARKLLNELVSWMQPHPKTFRAKKVLFSWGPFRFTGALENLNEEWVRFDPDGTPVRAWIQLVLKGRS